jgi:hypothetical protein
VEDRQAREICLARNPRSGGEISWAVRLRPSSPRRSRDPARIHDKTRTPGTHLSRKASWPSTFTMPALRPQRSPPLRHRSESQQREKPLRHPPGASHRAPPARSTRTVPTPCGLRYSLRHARQRGGRGHTRQPSAASKGVASGARGGVMQVRSRSTNASGQHRQAQRAGVKDRSRRAVTAIAARGAAREPDGAGRRHAPPHTHHSPGHMKKLPWSE